MPKYHTGILLIELEGEVTKVDVDDMMSVNTEDLTYEFSRQASLLAWTSTLTADAEAEWNAAKRELDETRARIYHDVRMDMLTDGDKVTEARIDAAVVQSSGYLDAAHKESMMKMQYRMLRGILDALDAKGSMLQSLGAHLRAELDQTGMVTRLKETLRNG